MPLVEVRMYIFRPKNPILTKVIADINIMEFQVCKQPIERKQKSKGNFQTYKIVSFSTTLIYFAFWLFDVKTMLPELRFSYGDSVDIRYIDTIMKTNIPSILLITAALYSLTGFIRVFKISSQALAATPDKLDDTEL